MSRVAIVFAPLGVSRDFIDYPFFADLGAVQAAALVRARGHAVTLIDALAMPGATLTPIDPAPAPTNGGAPNSSGEVRLGAPPADVLASIPSDADAFVIALTPFHRPPARDPLLASILEPLRARFPAAPIVLADLYQSGQHVVDAPSDQILAAYPEADVLLRYEAELDLIPLLDRLLLEGRPPRPFAANGRDPSPLDEIPLPAWDLVDLAAYFRFHADVVRLLGRPRWAFPIDGQSAPIVTSRGCPYRCAHCSSNPGSRRDGEQIAPKTQRRYSPAYLDRLLASLAERGVRRVHLLDELVNVSERHFDAVLELLHRHGLAFEIPNGMRADYVLPRHLELMKGRITTLSVSAESGVQRVVTDIVGKDLDLNAIDRAAELASEAGIPALVHFMIGLPGETRRDINGTLDYALRLYERTGAWPSVQFATPLPGTRLAKLALAPGHKSLPLINDFGPHFQREPSITSPDVSLADLRRFKWTFDERLAASQGPKKVIMNVTYKCNNRCTFCATGTRTQFDGDLTRQRELLVKYRRAGVRLLDFDGGEPTLNPNLFTLIKLARSLGYERVNVTTNARMASYRAFAERLAASGVTSILTSIHGPDAQTHAQNVGVAEAFDQTCEGVRNLVAVADPARVELGANITLTKSNYKKLGDVAALIHALGLRWFNIQFLTPFGRATSSIAPDTADAARETMRVIDAYEGRLKFQVINLPFCFMPGYERYLMGDMLKLERHMLFVNNEEVNLFDYLRERRVKKPVCEACPHAIFCGGFYEMDDVPEPTWLIRPEDLVRPIQPEIPRVSG